MKRPTKTLLIDAAEVLFAEKGYRSTSMEDISSVVGIRPSAIYKHFRNKQELYEAVLDRMAEPFFEMLDQFDPAENPITYMQKILQYNLDNQNLARFAFHATLGSGAHRKLLIKRWYQPYWERIEAKIKQGDFLKESTTERQRSFFTAFNNLMLGYITLATLNSDTLDYDPLSDSAVQDQMKLLQQFGDSLLK